MNPFGTSRSRIAPDHALIVPEGHVRTALPGWIRTQGVVLISPQMGARFAQTLAFLEADSGTNATRPMIERFFYVLSGQVMVSVEAQSALLVPGGYAFISANTPHTLVAQATTRLLVFEKLYAPLPDSTPPKLLCGHEQQVEAHPFLGDPDARLKTLLPDIPSLDMAINIFTYQPGATLPMVETHVMEHGLFMLQGAGVYRLADSWYPVQEGDAIWMASYCPQWFVAMGKTPARYIYYKDVNRDPLETAR